MPTDVKTTFAGDLLYLFVSKLRGFRAFFYRAAYNGYIPDNVRPADDVIISQISERGAKKNVSYMLSLEKAYSSDVKSWAIGIKKFNAVMDVFGRYNTAYQKKIYSAGNLNIKVRFMSMRQFYLAHQSGCQEAVVGMNDAAQRVILTVLQKKMEACPRVPTLWPLLKARNRRLIWAYLNHFSGENCPQFILLSTMEALLQIASVAPDRDSAQAVIARIAESQNVTQALRLEAEAARRIIRDRELLRANMETERARREREAALRIPAASNAFDFL